MTDKEIQQLEDKKFLANSKDRAKNTAEISKKLEELKPLKEVAVSNFPESKFPEQVTVKLQGIEVLTLKGDKGDKPVPGIDFHIPQDGHTPTSEELLKLIKPLIPKVKDGYTPKKGVDYFDGETGMDGANADPADVVPLVLKEIKLPKPDTAQQILGKLNSLKDAWLEVKAIKGFEDYMREFGDNFLNQAKGFAPRALASLYDVDLRSIANGQAIIWDSTKQKFVPGASTGGGLTKLTATGTVDGSNTAFTFTTKPTYVVSDGAWYVENSGWTWSGSTATLSVPPQTGIWGFV